MTIHERLERLRPIWDAEDAPFRFEVIETTRLSFTRVSRGVLETLADANRAAGALRRKSRSCFHVERIPR